MNESKGIINIGNSCFLASSIQCLLNSSYFMKMISNVSSPIVDEIKSYSNNSIINPLRLKVLLAQKDKFFNTMNQEDVYESLLKILDIIHNETKMKILIGEQQKNNPWFDYIKGNGYSFVNSIFSGQLVNIFTCRNCRHRRSINEVFNSIDLEMYEDDSKNNIYDSFYDYFHEIEVGPIDCEKCKLKVLHNKIGYISSYPKSLIINIKRFNNNGSKNNNVYDLEKILNFRLKNKNIFYKLKVMIYHIGTNPYSGHYITIVPKSNEKMLIINDEKIFEKELNINSRYSYLLVYDFFKEKND